MSALTYPNDVLDLIDLTETDDVQAGTRAYLSCKDGHLLSETLANYVDLKGFGVSIYFRLRFGFVNTIHTYFWLIIRVDLKEFLSNYLTLFIINLYN